MNRIERSISSEARETMLESVAGYLIDGRLSRSERADFAQQLRILLGLEKIH